MTEKQVKPQRPRTILGKQGMTFGIVFKCPIKLQTTWLQNEMLSDVEESQNDQMFAYVVRAVK